MWHLGFVTALSLVVACLDYTDPLAPWNDPADLRQKSFLLVGSVPAGRSVPTALKVYSFVYYNYIALGALQGVALYHFGGNEIES